MTCAAAFSKQRGLAVLTMSKCAGGAERQQDATVPPSWVFDRPDEPRPYTGNDDAAEDARLRLFEPEPTGREAAEWRSI